MSMVFLTKFEGGSFVCIGGKSFVVNSQPVSELFILFIFFYLFLFHLALLGIGPEPGGPA